MPSPHAPRSHPPVKGEVTQLGDVQGRRGSSAVLKLDWEVKRCGMAAGAATWPGFNKGSE